MSHLEKSQPSQKKKAKRKRLFYSGIKKQFSDSMNIQEFGNKLLTKSEYNQSTHVQLKENHNQKQ